MIILYDTPEDRLNLYPFSLTRPLGELYMGMQTLQQWWQSLSGLQVALLSEDYLDTASVSSAKRYYCINATVLPQPALLEQITALSPGQAIGTAEKLIAYCTNNYPVYNQLPNHPVNTALPAGQQLSHSADLFKLNQWAITSQFDQITRAGHSVSAGQFNTLIGAHNIFIEEGAVLCACIINATDGPVYIGRNALIMEGSIIHGPVAIGQNAVVKMGAKIYPGTSIGDFCVVGGEIKNSIIMPYSNKAHDGYLGDSVIGSWCNLGAGTSNSNVKNTAGQVKLWHQGEKKQVNAGIKAGLLMGDYSRAAINTSFNTGTVIGVCCNVFGTNYPPVHLPSFSWSTLDIYRFEKAVEHINNWKKLKGQSVSNEDTKILRHIFDQAGQS